MVLVCLGKGLACLGKGLALPWEKVLSAWGKVSLFLEKAFPAQTNVFGFCSGASNLYPQVPY